MKPLVTWLEVFEATEVDIGLFQEGARSVHKHTLGFSLTIPTDRLTPSLVSR